MPPVRVTELGPERLRLLAVSVPALRLITPSDELDTPPAVTLALALKTPDEETERPLVSVRSAAAV